MEAQDRAASAQPAAEPRAYVWQRRWTPSLVTSVREHAREFAALDVLVAEVALPSGTPRTLDIAPDWTALRSCGRPVGVVVRVGPSSSRWERDSAETRTVVRVCRSALTRAAAAGVRVAELQLDFDAATSRLVDYRRLLETLRREVAAPRLGITVLPAWLARPEFRQLVAAADVFVLQVHSLERPRSIDALCNLCDVERAKTWIDLAARTGRPFRAALPSYGYRVGFSASGGFVGLQAEAAREWPAGTRLKLVMADAASLAELVRHIEAVRPPSCEGIVWFRLPAADDELSWRWPTLAAVMRGIAPAARLVLQTERDSDGAVNLIATNDGNADGAGMATFRLHWTAGRLLAADAIAGWRVERLAPDAVLVRQTNADRRLRPGDRVRVGWLRLSEAGAIGAESL